MSCSITSFAETLDKKLGVWKKVEGAFSLDDYDKKINGEQKGDNPFYIQSYATFAFLSGVRNSYCAEPLSKPRGIPRDCNIDIWTEYESDRRCLMLHSSSFLTLRELVEFDYDKTFWNRRVTKEVSKGCFDGESIAEEGEGRIISYREFLPDIFFTHLEELKQLGNLDEVRVIFWFDN